MIFYLSVVIYILMILKKLTYKHTLVSSYVGYITQAVVNNLVPLLFSAFAAQLGISVFQISLIIIFNFGIQISVDLFAAAFVDKIGMRRCAVAAHVFAALGLFSLSVLPFLTNEPIVGIIISVMLSAVGGGLCEVVISPVVQSLPLENKAAGMNLLHSFYCWGQMAVVLLSTLYFSTVGIQSWRWLPLLWAVIPALNAVLFSAVPIGALCEPEQRTGVRRLVSSPLFILFFLLMVCAGSSELAMSQWASYFAEQGLHVSKTAGDLLGPCSFAFTMGLSRVLFARMEKRFSLETLLSLSSAGCVICYLAAALFPLPLLSLSGCALCGMTVGLMWPGVISLAAKKYNGGAMFAVLAFGGDIGCTVGPWLVGMTAGAYGLRTGLLAATVFPLIMLIGCLRLKKFL